jgi:predicted metal-dependent phosphoesterase TrpH
MIKYDLHIHTDASPCSNTSPKSVAAAAQKAGLDGIAITNHDTLEGYEAVRDAAPDKLDVLPGVEVTTTQGHILAIGVDSVPSQGKPKQVIEDIHNKGGLAILAHPFDRLREHFRSDIDNLVHLAKLADGIEVANSRCLFERFNQRALSFSECHDIAITGGSDAHFPMEVGRSYTLVDDFLSRNLKNKETISFGRGRYMSGHFVTKIHELRTLLRSWS